MSARAAVGVFALLLAWGRLAAPAACAETAFERCERTFSLEKALADPKIRSLMPLTEPLENPWLGYFECRGLLEESEAPCASLKPFDQPVLPGKSIFNSHFCREVVAQLGLAKGWMDGRRVPAARCREAFSLRVSTETDMSAALDAICTAFETGERGEADCRRLMALPASKDLEGGPEVCAQMTDILMGRVVPERCPRGGGRGPLDAALCPVTAAYAAARSGEAAACRADGLCRAMRGEGKAACGGYLRRAREAYCRARNPGE